MGYYSSLLIRVHHIVYIFSIIGLGLNFELFVCSCFLGFLFFLIVYFLLSMAEIDCILKAHELKHHLTF